MARRVVGLDLGAYSVKLVRLECSKQDPKIVLVDQIEEILPLTEDPELSLLERQQEIVKSLHQKGLLDAEACAVALNAADGHMRIMKAPFYETRKIEAVLPGILDAELPFDTSDMAISWHRAERPSTDLSKEKPKEATIRLAFGKKSAIASELSMLQAASVDPRMMHLSSCVGYELVRELGFDSFVPPREDFPERVSCIIDFGHRATNLCIYDKQGIRFSRSFLRGGLKLTEDIAQALSVSFQEAEALKHQVDLKGGQADSTQKTCERIATLHYQELCDEFLRTFITLKTRESLTVDSVLLIGGAAQIGSLDDFIQSRMGPLLNICSHEALAKLGLAARAMAMPLALALSCVQVHVKENRFNFRKDEFAWRGDLDFLRTKSTPLILWSLVVICSITIMWSANSLVLQKENVALEQRLKNVCTQILGQANVPAKKCLAMMQEQISTSSEVTLPEYTASDLLIKASELLPKDTKVVFSEFDVSEKKVRIAAEVSSFEDVDKVAVNLNKVPCLVNIEKGAAQKKDDIVKVSFSGDIDCNPKQPKSKVEKKVSPKSKPETEQKTMRS